MNAVEVRDQVRLPLSKCVELVLSGVRFRLFRAAVTVVIISLAVAFLMTILAEGITARQVAGAIREETAPRRLFTAWISRLRVPMTELELSRELYAQVTAQSGPAPETVPSDTDVRNAVDATRRLAEMQRWGGLTDEEMTVLKTQAVEQFRPETGVWTYFATLSEGELRPLVGSARGMAIFEYLSDPEHPQRYAKFQEELQRLGKKLPFDGGHDELNAFLARWREAAPLRQRIIDGQATAIAAADQSLFKGEDPKTVIAAADESLIETLRSAGFDMAPEEFQTVKVQAALAVDAETIEKLLGSSFLKGLLARRVDVKLAQVSNQMLFEAVSTDDGAWWLCDLADKSRGFAPLNMTGDRIMQVALSQVPLTHMQMAVDLDLASPDKIMWKSIVAWGELSAEEMKTLVDLAHRQEPYNEFFNNLNDNDRSDLLGDTTVTNPFGRCRTEDGFKLFLTKLKEQSKVLPEPTRAAAERVLDARIAELKARRETLSDAQEIEKIDQQIQQFAKDKDAKDNTGNNLPDAQAVFRHFLEDWKAAASLRDSVKTGREASLQRVHDVLGIDTLRSDRAVYAEKVARMVELDNLGPQAMAEKLRKEIESLQKELDAAAEADKAQDAAFIDGLIEKRRLMLQRLDSGDGPKLIEELRGEVDALDKQISAALTAAAAAMSDPSLADPVARQQASDTLAAEQILSLLAVPLVREQAALRLRVPLYEIERLTQADLLKELTTKTGADSWFAQLVRRISGLRPLEMDVARVRDVAGEKLRQTELADIEASVATAAGGGQEGLFAGFSAKTMWLIVVSFMVCIVGIANAMLMSVTERFREIATMKCLGATDGFIMINFVLESCLQGVVGGVFGAIVGFLLGLLQVMGSYGMMAVQHMPWADLVAMAGISMVVGLGISALAAVYPAWAAARLAPMEAMRIE